MPAIFSNNASTTLAAAIASTDTSITVATGTGALFPALTGANYFYATLVDASNNIEIVKVTARSSDTLTVARGQEGTTPLAYAIGDKVELRITAAGLANKLARDEVFSIAQSQVTGLAAALATLTANQIPAGSRTVFHQAAAPTGWTQDTTSVYNDIAIRIVTGAGHGGYSGGQAFSAAVARGTVATHAITQAELPNCTFAVSDPGHPHLDGGLGAVAAGGSYWVPTTTGTPNHDTQPAYTGIGVSSGGSDTPHPHGFTGAGLDLNYTNFIMCQKN